MDLTIEVMLPPRGANDYTQSANERYRVLAPIAVYPLKTVATVGMPRTGYVHVTGIPDRPAWANLTQERIIARISKVLCEEWHNPSWEPETTYLTGALMKPISKNGFRYRVILPGISGSEQPIWPALSGATVIDGSVTWATEINERRRWAGVASGIPANARNRLLNDRQITVTWTQFKNVLRHVIEQRQLADGDLE